MDRGHRAAVAVCACALVGLALFASGLARASVVAPQRPVAVGAARVLGDFTMDGVIARAINVRGERVGERVTRRWLLRPGACVQSTCRRLVLLRTRGAGAAPLKTVLALVGPGAYRGTGFFWSALRCLGHTYRHGSRVPYTIRLWVRGRLRVGDAFYATRLYATYVNPSRTDRTPCPLGPASDAALYRGVLRSR